MPIAGDYIQNSKKIGSFITVVDPWDDAHEVGISFSGTVLESGISYFATEDGSLLSQQIDFVQTKEFGTVFLLDNLVMTVDKPELEASYHEIIAHTPLIEHPDPKHILIIGGGDGGVAREVLKHQNIEHCTMVEIDKNVIEQAKKYIPGIAQYLREGHPKFTVLTQDGIAYINKCQPESFDIIINDLTDPDVGDAISSRLFGRDFYIAIEKALKPNGIIITQAESALADNRTLIRSAYDDLRSVFPSVVPLLSNVMMYPSDWLFFMGSKDANKQWKTLSALQQQRLATIEQSTIIYNGDIHQSIFSIPNYTKHILFS